MTKSLSVTPTSLAASRTRADTPPQGREPIARLAVGRESGVLSRGEERTWNRQDVSRTVSSLKVKAEGGPFSLSTNPLQGRVPPLPPSQSDGDEAPQGLQDQREGSALPCSSDLVLPGAGRQMNQQRCTDDFIIA